MGKIPHRLLTAIGVLALAAVSSPGFARELTIDERVAHQRAIEQVYWNHRVWPPENPTTKPPLSAVMPDAALRAKVEDYLKKSNALTKHWQRPVTSEQLQAEMDRMARDTRDGATLLELFRALNDDPYVIAETLARQTLVDRLIHNWYAVDTRFHGEVKAKAVAPPFDSWWQAESTGIGSEIAPSSGSFAGPLVPATTCTNDSWSAIGVDAPDPRSTRPAVWTGTEMIVWGGRDGGGGYLNTGGRYSPSTNSWTATSTGTNVPTGRGSHTVVWSGTEMIMWGGAGPDYVNTGSRYNPSTDTWSPTSTGANVPLKRGSHTAVWTGTEMLVWGGYNDTSVMNTGGRYDPSTNTWIATSTGASVPAARYDHTAVWTGAEMIVWGGDIGGGFYRNTGGRYSPSTNSWTATSTGTNVPAGRGFHTGVWSGTEMIIWGGTNMASFFNTGGRYSPSTNTWIATSTSANVPVARFSHTAVWTAAEMIVWGGTSSTFISLNTGGRYSPSTNAWTATSTGANVPAARAGHAAVWTSTEMIVWNGNATPATGGLYCACPNGVLGYRDADGDGFGNPAISVPSCDGVLPAGYVADSSDCDDTEASAWAVPGTALGLAAKLSISGQGFTDLEWQSLAGHAGSGVRYDIVAGSLTHLSGATRFTDAECLESDIEGTSATVSRPDPAPESGDWFLVRAQNACGIGTYDENNPAQTGSRDAQVGLSPLRCAP